MALAFISAITVDGKTCSKEAIEAAIEGMGDTFDNMQIAGIIGRSGFEPNDLWIGQEVANRLLQRIRRAGLACSPSRRRWYSNVPHMRIVDAVRIIEESGMSGKQARQWVVEQTMQKAA